MNSSAEPLRHIITSNTVLEGKTMQTMMRSKLIIYYLCQAKDYDEYDAYWQNGGYKKKSRT